MVEKPRRDGHQTKPLPDCRDRNEEARGDLLFAKPLLAQGLEGTELIEWM